jgi:hypothetical protein
VKLNPLFRGLVFAGLAAYLVAAGAALVRRRLSAGLVVCTALLASVAARAVMLALVDALSFSAASQNYALPAIALLVLFSVLALGEAVSPLLRRPRAGAAPG